MRLYLVLLKRISIFCACDVFRPKCVGSIFFLIVCFSGSYTPPRKTPSKNYIFQKNAWPKLHFPECTYFPERALAKNCIFLNRNLPEITLARRLISQKLRLPEFAFFRKLILQNWHLPEFTFCRNYISWKLIFQNLHLPKFAFDLTEITFPRKLIFQNLHLVEISQHFLKDLFSTN